MFSKLDGIFAGLPPRHVENANTRLEIRRDESQGGKNKKDGHGEDEFTPIPWEDISYVSIASLKAFLESLIVVESDTLPMPPVHEASNTLNQRAASAYQSVGRAVHDENVNVPVAQQNTHIETHFTEQDLARVRIYVADLVELERSGISELGMERSTTFLDSIGAAIEQAKSTL